MDKTLEKAIAIRMATIKQQPATTTTNNTPSVRNKDKVATTANPPAAAASDNNNKKDVVKKEGEGKDQEPYWTINSGYANRPGHSCRECKGAIYKDDPIIMRTGRLTRLFYHLKCYSGSPDPRTQDHSSFPKYKDRLAHKAPSLKGHGKWMVHCYDYKATKPLSISPNDAKRFAYRYEKKKRSGDEGNLHECGIGWDMVTPVVITYDAGNNKLVSVVNDRPQPYC